MMQMPQKTSKILFANSEITSNTVTALIFKFLIVIGGILTEM